MNKYLRTNVFALCFAFTLTLVACTGKDEDDPVKPPKRAEDIIWDFSGKTWDLAPGADVYVLSNCGIIIKNGIAQKVSNEPNYRTYALFVSGEDVYVAGTIRPGTYTEPWGSDRIAVLWKNGVSHYLSNERGDAEPSSIYVSGDDVYVSGTQRLGHDKLATLWVNSVPQYLHGDWAEAWSVFVDGDDVYVGGSAHSQPVIWKNGQEFSRHRPPSSLTGVITSVFVSDGDVYAAMCDFAGIPRASVWKNDKVTILGINASAYSAFVYGGDVYATGLQDIHPGNPDTMMPMLWKNGEPQILGDGDRLAISYSVYVCDGDVYAAGYNGNMTHGNASWLWINGESHELRPYGFTSTSIPYSLFVVSKTN